MKRDRDRNRKWRQDAAKRYRERREERARKGELTSTLGKSSTPLPRRAQPTTGYRLWVRATQRCAVPGCGKASPDPHHVRARGSGRSVNPWKEDERNVCPLCRRHHQLGDSPGWSWRRFEDERLHGRPLQEIADELWERWMELPEETRKRWEGRAYRLNTKRGARPATRREVR